jgi:hypothetical protein
MTTESYLVNESNAVTVTGYETRRETDAEGNSSTRRVLVSRVEERVRQVLRTRVLPPRAREAIERAVEQALQLGEQPDPLRIATTVLANTNLFIAATGIDTFSAPAAVEETLLTGAETIDPKRAQEIEFAVTALDSPLEITDVFIDLQLDPDEQAYAASLAADRWPPRTIDGSDFSALTFTLGEWAGADADGGMMISAMFADRAIDPNEASAENQTGEFASAAMSIALSTRGGTELLLNHLGSANLPRFLGTLGLEAETADLSNPRVWNSGVRRGVLSEFLESAARLPPSETQAALVFNTIEAAGAVALEDTSFRATIGRSLASVFALGDRPLTESEGARLAELFANNYVGEALIATGGPEREQLIVALLQMPGLTSALLDEHHGNLATAQAYAQLSQVNSILADQFSDGIMPYGPDGTPYLTGDSSFLPQTSAEAAAYIRSLAAESRRIGNPELSTYGADWLTARAIELFGGGNPIIESNLDDIANQNAESLERLALAIESSDDPEFISQAVLAGHMQNELFRNSLQPYGDAIDLMAERTQRNRVYAMIGVGIVASFALPMMIAAGLPAFGTAGTIFGMSVTGSPFLSAALPAAASAALSTTTNAASQYEMNGTVSWGNAIAGGAVDGLTSFFGATVAARAMQRGHGFLRSVGTAAALDAAGGFGAYVLGTPGALQGLLSGDETHLNAALANAGFGFALSFGVNGLMFRNNLGPTPPLGSAQGYANNADTLATVLGQNGPLFDGSLPVYSLTGEQLSPGQILDAAHESYFAVYRNSRTGDLAVYEVARARPGQALALDPFDAVQGVRRGSPGAGWEAVGGFHNHPNGFASASPSDLTNDPLFRGELGAGFANGVLSRSGANLYGGPDIPPLTLAEAYRTGVASVFGQPMLTGAALPQNWERAIDPLIDNYSRGLNAIIANPNLPAAVRASAMEDMTEMYRRFGAVIRGADNMGGLSADGRAELARLNQWLRTTMPPYAPHFEASGNYYNFSNQVSVRNSAAANALQMPLLYRIVGLDPASWLDGLRPTPSSQVHLVGVANGGGPIAGTVWDDALRGGFDPDSGGLGMLVPTSRAGGPPTNFALTLDPPPQPGDVVVLVDDVYSGGNTARAAINWMKKNYPGVEVRFVASGASGTHNGAPMNDWSSVYGLQ